MKSEAEIRVQAFEEAARHVPVMVGSGIVGCEGCDWNAMTGPRFASHIRSLAAQNSNNAPEQECRHCAIGELPNSDGDHLVGNLFVDTCPNAVKINAQIRARCDVGISVDPQPPATVDAGKLRLLVNRAQSKTLCVEHYKLLLQDLTILLSETSKT